MTFGFSPVPKEALLRLEYSPTFDTHSWGSKAFWWCCALSTETLVAWLAAALDVYAGQWLQTRFTNRPHSEEGW